MPFLNEEGLIRAKGRIGKSQLEFNAKNPPTIATLETSCSWIILAKRAQGQSTRRHWTCQKHCAANDVDPKHKKRLKINQEQVCYLQKGRAQTIAQVMAD